MPPLPLREDAPAVLGAARGAVRQSDADLKAESAVSMGRHILADASVGSRRDAARAFRAAIPCAPKRAKRLVTTGGSVGTGTLSRTTTTNTRVAVATWGGAKPATKPKKERGEL